MESTAEFLLVRGKKDADPFNRLGCTIEPVVTVIEFCQIIGPRPLAAFPDDACKKAHLDMDSIAIWLMSSETAAGTVLMIFNQQMGIYALSYYTLIYDARARAFQRPICLAYLSTSRPTGELMERFTKSVKRYLSPLIMCNRKLFLHQLSIMIQLSGIIETNTVQNYYSFQSDDKIEVAPSVWQKILHVAEQARRLRPKMEGMYASLASRMHLESECVGHNGSNDELEIEKTLEQFVRSAPLQPIEELSPCTYAAFIEGLPVLHSQLNIISPPRAVLFSSGVPVLQFPRYETPVKERAPDPDEKIVFHNEESLKMITGSLEQVLFPVLTGDSLSICGSEQRRSVVMELTHKLNRIMPKSHTNREDVLWNTDPRIEHVGISGECVPKGGTRRTNKKGAIFDLNANVLRCVPYSGRLLSQLSIRRKFPNDSSLIAYLISVLTWLCSAVYICRFVTFQTLSKKENLSDDDFRIIANLLCEIDFIKYNSIKNSLEKSRDVDAEEKTFNL